MVTELNEGLNKDKQMIQIMRSLCGGAGNVSLDNFCDM